MTTLTTNANNTVAPAMNWLDAASTLTNANYVVTGNTWGHWWEPCYSRRPIALTLSEVEKLRAAARKDAKLKAILQKFTGQIEITVDFE